MRLVRLGEGVQQRNWRIAQRQLQRLVWRSGSGSGGAVAVVTVAAATVAAGVVAGAVAVAAAALAFLRLFRHLPVNKRWQASSSDS